MFGSKELKERVDRLRDDWAAESSVKRQNIALLEKRVGEARKKSQ